MGRRWRSEDVDSVSGSEGGKDRQVIFVSSSDDEEANEDLSLAIVRKAQLREARRKKTEEEGKARSFFLELSSSSVEEIDGVPNGKSSDAIEELVAGRREEVKKNRKKTPKKRKKNEVEEGTVTELPDPLVEENAAVGEDNRTGMVGSCVEEGSEPLNNVILRKLLRGPRYFDPGDSKWETCYNCGEGGHTAASCSEERRQKPCFVCGVFGHLAKQCIQGHDCFICRRRGHLAKDCPDKNKTNCQDSSLCLRCGDVGHDMASCGNNYAPNDLKEIQCYICKKYGHLCCVDYLESCPRRASCYNCAEPGHTGQGCAKRMMGDQVAAATPTLCYRCGQEGHFARGCTTSFKPAPRAGESTPVLRDKKASRGSRSMPWDLGRDRRKSRTFYDESSMSVKSRVKGGWIVDDSEYLPRRKVKPTGWRSSPRTPKKSHDCYLGASNSRSSSGHRRRFTPSGFRNYEDFFG